MLPHRSGAVTNEIEPAARVNAKLRSAIPAPVCCRPTGFEPMRIATFNINGVTRRLLNLLDWLEELQPDVVCLQELKATDKAFPATVLRDAGYGAVWRGEHRWNGVAILARGTEPVLSRTSLPGDPRDAQSRYL